MVSFIGETKALFTLMRFRFPTTILMHFQLSTLKRSKTIELHVVTQVELYAHASNTRACDIFGHRFHFDAFFTVFDRPN